MADGQDTGSNVDKYSFHDLFELGDVLGEGGYAVVRIATNMKTSQKVAVKIAKRVHIDAGRESALRREFDILHSLQHPNIVHAIGLYEEAQNFYVVLEYMDGGELFDRIVKKTQYTEKEARDAVRYILHAVEYFHLHGVVHRDLKPENLLLESKEDDSNLKIADFGLARVVDGTSIVGKAGTPEYWAPEVLESRECGKPVDIWSLGVITFVLLGGYAPFHHKDPQIMYSNIGKGVFKFHPQRWTNVSAEAKAFICSLLTVDPSRRPTATEALAHSWLHQSDSLLMEKSLTENLEELRKFNALRKFRSGVNAVRGVQKLLKIVKVIQSSPKNSNGSNHSSSESIPTNGNHSNGSSPRASPRASLSTSRTEKMSTLVEGQSHEETEEMSGEVKSNTGKAFF